MGRDEKHLDALSLELTILVLAGNIPRDSYKD